MDSDEEKEDFGGVWPLPPRLGRPKPFGIQWREWEWDPAANGGQGTEVVRRKTEFFKTEEARDAAAAARRKAKARGQGAIPMRAEIEEFRAFKAAIGNANWREVVNGWRSDLANRGMIECSATVLDAAKREIDRATKLVDEGKMSADTLRQKRQKLDLWAEHFGPLPLNKLKGIDVEAWIDGLEWVEKGATFNNYLKFVRNALTPYVKSGMIPRNPCESVVRRDETTDTGINDPQEMAVLFDFALRSDRHKVAIGRLALEAFVGLRFSSGARLEKADINFEDKGILLPRQKLKTGMVEGGKSHYIDGVIPEQIWAWLAVTPDECWALSERQYERLKCELFLDAKVRHPPNTFRHSFCTFDMLMHKKASRTAYILGHQDEDLIYQRYKGLRARGRIMTEADGKLYQSLTPATVAKVAKGYVPPAELLHPAA